MHLASQRSMVINKFRYGPNFFAIIGSLGGKATNGGRFKEPGFAQAAAYKSWQLRRGYNERRQKATS